MSSDLNSTEHFRAAIIGGGPAGIGAAVGLAKRGVAPLVIIEHREELGGIPALYKKKPDTIPTFVRWTRGQVIFGEEYARILCNKLSGLNLQTWTQSHVFEIQPEEKKLHIISPHKGAMSITADAIVMACGAREMTLAERGFLLGARPAKLYFTKNMLDLIDANGCLPISHPLVIGSDVLAYAVAAKLEAAGSSRPIMIDRRTRPMCNAFQRLYFHRLQRFEFHGSVHSIEIMGSKLPSPVKLSNGDIVECDGIVVSGELIPNSELALNSGIEVQLPSRKLVLSKEYQLSKSGWFAAGNVLGRSHGAEWCYLNGLRVARSVKNYLSRSV